jgi:N-methylhydantoinase A
MLMSDFKHDFVRPLKTPLAEADPHKVAALLEAIAVEARAVLDRERVAREQITLRPSVDLRYVGQWHELSVPLEWSHGTAPDLERLLSAFHAQHDLLFGYSTDEMPVEALAVRLSAVGSTAKPALRTFAGGVQASEARVGSRPIWSPAERAMVDADVYDGTRLGPGAQLTGPCVVELANTTIVAHEDLEVGVERFGAFVLWRGDNGRSLADRILHAEPVGA